jgi:hypothetical protein
MKSCRVPRNTSVGVGRKSGCTIPPYVTTHHAPRTSVGATKPNINASLLGNGERIEKRLFLR